VIAVLRRNHTGWVPFLFLISGCNRPNIVPLGFAPAAHEFSSKPRDRSMAAAQPARFSAPSDDIANWMAERWRDIANLGPEAEDAGRRLWALATRSGQDISTPNPSDVYALGAQFLNGGTANSAAALQQQPDPSQSAAPDTSDNPTDDDDWSDYPWLGGDATSPPAFGQGGLLQLAAAPGKGFWDYWSVPGCANCHG